MGAVMTVLAAIGGLIGAICLGLLKDEAAAWLPRANRWILEAAVRRVPGDQRERYREEWAAHVDEYPGKLSQTLQSLRCLGAGEQMRAISEGELARKKKFIAIVIIAVSIVPPIYDRFHEYGWWAEHILGFANFYVTALFVWATYWVIRLKPQLLGTDRGHDRSL